MPRVFVRAALAVALLVLVLEACAPAASVTPTPQAATRKYALGSARSRLAFCLDGA